MPRAGLEEAEDEKLGGQEGARTIVLYRGATEAGREVEKRGGVVVGGSGVSRGVVIPMFTVSRIAPGPG